MTFKAPWLEIDRIVEYILDRRGVTPLKLGGDFVKSGHRVISAKVIKDGRVQLDADEPRYVDDDIYSKWMRTPLCKDDVLMTSEAPLGELAYLDKNVDWVLGQRLFAIRPKAGLLSGRYLYYALRLSAIRADILGRASGTTVQGIRQAELRQVRIPVPPFATQESAATVLATLDDRITLLRETNVTLEAIAQALFKSWFVDFDPVRARAEGRTPDGLDEATAALFPNSFEDSALGFIPRGWRTDLIGKVCNLGRGSSPRPIQEFMGNDIPWLKIADATASDGMFLFSTKEKIKREGASKSVAVRRGDLIMSNSASCGIPIFVELEGCIHDGWLYFREFQAVNKCFMFYWLRHISNYLISIADGTVQKNLNIALVSSQKILCPPSSVLGVFESILQPLLDQIKENCVRARVLGGLRDTLLPRLISGQLRIPDAEALAA